MRTTLAFLATLTRTLAARGGSDDAVTSVADTEAAATDATDAPTTTAAAAPAPTETAAVVLTRDAEPSLRECLDDAGSAHYQMQIVGPEATDPDILDIAYDDLGTATDWCGGLVRRRPTPFRNLRGTGRFPDHVRRFQRGASVRLHQGLGCTGRPDPVDELAAYAYESAIQHVAAASDELLG